MSKDMYEFGQKIYVCHKEGEALEKKSERIFINYGKDNSVIVVVESDTGKFEEGYKFEAIKYNFHAAIPEPTYKPIPHEQWLEFFGKPMREVDVGRIQTIDVLNPDNIVLSTGSTRDFEEMMEWEIYLDGKWSRLHVED